jgi:hypothetical protein
MSGKYVPPSMRNQHRNTYTNITTPANVSGGASVMHDASVSSASMSHNVKPSTLVNTSLPAKEAPSLVPGTLASLTSSGDVPSVTSSFKNMELDKVSIYKGNNITKKPNLTEDDFPTLGAKPVTKASVKPAMNFAEKSREWAAKQKEDERIAAEEAEKESIRLSVERMMKEKEKQEEQFYKKKIVSIASLRRTAELEDEYNDRYVPEEEDEPYESPLEEEEEDKEEEEEYNSHWDGRRYRDEY